MDYSDIPTQILLADLQAQEDWLRDYPTHPTRKDVERECRARRRELADRGVEVEAVDVRSGGEVHLRRGYVVPLGDGTVGRNQVVHIGRDTCHVVTRFPIRPIHCARHMTSRRSASSERSKEGEHMRSIVAEIIMCILCGV